MISFQFLLSRLLLVGVLATSASASAAPDALEVDMRLPRSPPLRSQGELRIVNAELSPDGFSRIGVLADGQFPGPLITATKGEVLDITVYDELVDNSFFKSTSIHWHGLRQQGVAWADGPTQVTQCPISPGHSFRYRVRTDDLTGTYWYHSHIRGQYCDGLRGALVIYDPEDPHACLYDVDDESTVITLADWYHNPSTSFFQPGARVQANSTLINGLGRYQGGPATALAVINVEQGKRYRFRLIAMVCDPNYIFSIDGHTMTIIEADGINHEALEVDSLQIFAAQRYSFVLNAQQPIDNYWIRANPSATGIPGFEGGINSAILRYKGAPEQEPTVGRNVTSNLLQQTDLHPLESPGAPGEPVVDGADVNLNLAISFNSTAGRFQINGQTFVPPTVPVLLQILSGAKNAQSLLPSGSVYELPLNKTIQISMPNPDGVGSPHPMHLHGHHFDVIRSAGSSTYNFKNPVRRDVVSVGNSSTDNVTIRFRTDNAGPWFLHCHIEPHLGLGLAVVMAEGIQQTPEANPVPEEWNDLCPVYEATKANDLPLD